MKMKNSLLNRATIKRYFSTTNQKKRHSIEKEALNSSFENDALDGWGLLIKQNFSMKQMDKKFAQKKYLVSKGGFGFILLALISSTFIYFLNLENKTLNMPPIKTPKTSISKIEKEQSFKKIVHQPIIDNRQTSTDNKKLTTIESNPIPYKKEIVELNLPIKNVKTIQNELDKSPIIGTKAAEFYLYNLKLIDYRNYRSIPTLYLANKLPNGTSADLPNKSDNTKIELEGKNSFTYIEFLGEAIELFASNQYKKAIGLFSLIMKQYPDDVNANFYSGLCLIELKEFEKSIVFFNKVMNATFLNFDEEAEWSITKSLLNLNKKDEAEKILKKIVSEKGFYAPKAEALLNSN